MKLQVESRSLGSVKKCLQEVDESKPSSTQQQYAPKLTMVPAHLSSLTQHASSRCWGHFLNKLHQLLQHKVFSNFWIQCTVHLSVNDCDFFLYGFGIQKCEMNQFLFFLLLPNGKLLNKMFLILAGSTAQWNKCICSMLSIFDALALKFFAKECGLNRHSISFAYYFVYNMLHVDK